MVCSQKLRQRHTVIRHCSIVIGKQKLLHRLVDRGTNHLVKCSRWLQFIGLVSFSSGCNVRLSSLRLASLAEMDPLPAQRRDSEEVGPGEGQRFVCIS